MRQTLLRHGRTRLSHTYLTRGGQPQPVAAETDQLAQTACAYFHRMEGWKDILSDPAYSLRSPASRTRAPTREDALMVQTLNTPSTIPHFLILYPTPQEPKALIGHAKALLSLGGGMNGFPNTCHGGIITTILDEVMGTLISLNHQHHAEAVQPTAYMTAYLNTEFVKPLKTPSPGVLVTATVDRVEGRKVFMEATIEDNKKDVYATGKALFVGLKKQ